MPLTLVGRPEDEATLKERFSEGVTRFGLDIIHARIEPAASEREIRLEYVRLAHYTHRPSRYVSNLNLERATGRRVGDDPSLVPTLKATLFERNRDAGPGGLLSLREPAGFLDFAFLVQCRGFMNNIRK